MHPIPINVWAVLVAAASHFMVGGLWYSPLLFIRPWMKAAGISEDQLKAGMPKALATDVFTSLLIAYGLVHAILLSGAETLVAGLQVSFFCWLCFVTTTHVGSITHERRPPQFYVINMGYRLVTFLIAGTILTLWR